MDGQELLRRAPKRQDKKNKNRKYGRNGRTAKHRVGQLCGMKNCHKLAGSRYFDQNLDTWLSIPIGRGSGFKSRTV